MSKPPTRINVRAQTLDSPKDSLKSSTVKIAPVKDRQMAEQAGSHVYSDSKALEVEFGKFRNEMKALFVEMDGKISGRIESLDKKFSGMFKEFGEELASLKNEVIKAESKVGEVSDKVEGMERSLEFQAQTIEQSEIKLTEKLEKASSDLDTKIKAMNQKLKLLEKQDRKYNLLFYGVAEERSENLFEKIRPLCKEDLEIHAETVDNMYFAHGHRIPSERNEGPKPIIIRFCSYQDRELVLSRAYKLAGSRRRILSDLPVDMKKERGRLAKAAYDIRQNEKLQTRIRDKGLDVFLEVRKSRDDLWAKREA